MKAGFAWRPQAVAKYWAVFRTQISARLTYAGDLAAQSLTIVLFLWVFLQLWRVTYGASAEGGTQGVIAGLTLTDTLWYLMLAEAIILSKARLAPRISETVKDGSIAYLLNKPYNFVLYQASVMIADNFSAIFFNVVAGGALVWALVGPPPPVWGWPLALVAVLGAWLIDFCFGMLIGLAAFVTEEVSAFEWIYQKLLFLLGGLIIPLDFFPQWLQDIAHKLPFATILYGPARLFVDPSLERFGTLMAGQAFWLVVMGLLVAGVYRWGVARLAINGG